MCTCATVSKPICQLPQARSPLQWWQRNEQQQQHRNGTRHSDNKRTRWQQTFVSVDGNSPFNHKKSTAMCTELSTVWTSFLLIEQLTTIQYATMKPVKQWTILLQMKASFFVMSRVIISVLLLRIIVFTALIILLQTLFRFVILSNYVYATLIDRDFVNIICYGIQWSCAHIHRWINCVGDAMHPFRVPYIHHFTSKCYLNRHIQNCIQTY